MRNRSYSLGLERALTDFGAEESFQQATERVWEHYRVEVGESGLRRICLRHAEAMQFDFETEVQMPQGGVKEILAEIDGAFVPIVEIKAGQGDRRKRRECGWREARICLAGVVGSCQRRYRGSLGGTEQIGQQWRAAVVEAGGGKQTKLHCVGDGASWIVNQVKAQFGEQASYLVDFYHVSEYLSEASGSLGRDARQWLREAQGKLKKNEVTWVLSELEPHLEAETVADLEAPVRRAWRYLEGRKEQLDYQGAIAQGLPIGSGEIESGNRTVMQKRLKIAGAWWLKPNAEKMLALRCVRANQEWIAYWKSVRQAQA